MKTFGQTEIGLGQVPHASCPSRSCSPPKIWRIIILPFPVLSVCSPGCPHGRSIASCKGAWIVDDVCLIAPQGFCRLQDFLRGQWRHCSGTPNNIVFFANMFLFCGDLGRRQVVHTELALETRNAVLVCFFPCLE